MNDRASKKDENRAHTLAEYEQLAKRNPRAVPLAVQDVLKQRGMWPKPKEKK